MKSAEHILISRASKKSQLESLKMAIKTLGVCVCVCVCVFERVFVRVCASTLTETHANRDEPKRLHLSRGYAIA